MPKYQATSADFEDYADLETETETNTFSSKLRRAPKKSKAEILSQAVEATGIEAGFNPTYQPALYEGVWLLSSMKDFYEQHFISDILAVVKGGKEATVYRCQAYPETGLDLVAAKVYRPRQFRNLRNDKLYREGRAVLTGEGRVVKNSDQRVMRAIGKKTAYGEQVSHTSWLLYEYTTLQKLYKAGAAVPEPYAVNDNVIVMGYRGDHKAAAPTLHETTLPRRAAKPLFEEVLRNIELILQAGFVHGDLSAYNILYWEDQITLIDFPQVVDISTNKAARAILERDVQRVCEYFSRYDVKANPAALTETLWQKFGKIEPVEDLLPELEE